VIVAIAWAGAAVVALVVLGFCGYEVTWKRARLRADLRALAPVLDGLAAVQRDLTQAAARRPGRGRPR
jgi:hypothetical protein